MKAKDLIGRSLKLRALPKVVYQLQKLLDSDAATSVSIAHCLRNDPVLSIQVLRIANSSWYQLASKIDTISRAVTVIGYDAINNLVLASSVLGVFSKTKMPYFDSAAHWEHSLKTAILARLMAEKCNVLHSESYFIGGLLHDIGTMIIAMRLPELARTLYMHFQEETTPVHDIELQTLGFTHADVGGELMASWSLPSHLIEAVRHHHNLAEAKESPLSTAIIQIASAYIEVHTHDQERLERLIDPAAWQITGLDAEQLPGLLQSVRADFAELYNVFFSQAA